MSTIRVARRARYTTIDRETVNDERLSFKARGILLWLLDKPDNWRCDAAAIEAAGAEGREAVRSGLRELVDLGYMTRRKWQDEKGQWNTEVTVHERPDQAEDGEPTPDEPTYGFPSVGEPDAITNTENEDCERRVTTSLAPRARNLIFDALTDACGLSQAEMTQPALKACGVAASQLKAVGAEPDEIHRRAAAYRLKFKNASLTPSALARHWAECRPEAVLKEAAAPRTLNAAQRYAAGRMS